MTALTLLGVNDPQMGYGRLSWNLAAQLTERGYTIYPDLENDPAQPAGELACWVGAPTHAFGWWKGQHTANFTMWEASRYPEALRESLHEFDTILVPSKHNVELFSQYHPNVKYVPLGVDPDAWKVRVRPDVETEFRFLVGGSGKRKGADLVHKAFLKLWGREGSWGGGPTPKLIIKTPRSEDFYGPRVQMVTGKLGAEEEVDLYGHAHCYVQPSRGEGFGLQPLQAIAQGCPTILTDGHGHEAFSHLGIGLDWTWAKSGYFLYGDAGDWWEPKFDDLCNAMLSVYEHYDAHVSAAKGWAKEAHDRFTWSKTADQFLAAFDPNLFDDYAGPHDWQTPDAKLYRVRTWVPKTYTVGQRKWFTSLDRDEWVPAEVKRIAFENDALHPDCIEDDGALLPSEVARMGLSRANFCPTCGHDWSP